MSDNEQSQDPVQPPRPIMLPPASAGKKPAPLPSLDGLDQESKEISVDQWAAADPIDDEEESEPGPTRPAHATVAQPVVESRPGPQAAEAAVREAEEAAATTRLKLEEDVSIQSSSSTRLGICGGKGVGKSYLFQAMVYCTYNPKRAGVLNSYLGSRSGTLMQARFGSKNGQTVNVGDFLQLYRDYITLPQTYHGTQVWYRYSMEYRTGLLGRRRSMIDIELVDVSGELVGGELTPASRPTWEGAYQDTNVMIFCLPLWAVFPAPAVQQNTSDREQRARAIRQFETVVRIYRDIYQPEGQRPPIRTILALTMADDRRCRLRQLMKEWIHPFLGDGAVYPSKLRNRQAIPKYLASAREISEYLYSEFDDIADHTIAALPSLIDFGTKPWLLPVTAIDGVTLEELKAKYPTLDARPADLSLKPPQPAHVELPILIAICEHYNALM